MTELSAGLDRPLAPQLDSAASDGGGGGGSGSSNAVADVGPTPRRWVVLTAFSSLSAINCMMWITFAPVRGLRCWCARACSTSCAVVANLRVWSKCGARVCACVWQSFVFVPDDEFVSLSSRLVMPPPSAYSAVLGCRGVHGPGAGALGDGRILRRVGRRGGLALDDLHGTLPRRLRAHVVVHRERRRRAPGARRWARAAKLCMCLCPSASSASARLPSVRVSARVCRVWCVGSCESSQCTIVIHLRERGVPSREARARASNAKRGQRDTGRVAAGACAGASTTRRPSAVCAGPAFRRRRHPTARARSASLPACAPPRRRSAGSAAPRR